MVQISFEYLYIDLPIRGHSFACVTVRPESKTRYNANKTPLHGTWWITISQKTYLFLDYPEDLFMHISPHIS